MHTPHEDDHFGEFDIKDCPECCPPSEPSQISMVDSYLGLTPQMDVATGDWAWKDLHFLYDSVRPQSKMVDNYMDLCAEAERRKTLRRILRCTECMGTGIWKWAGGQQSKCTICDGTGTEPE